MSEKSAKETILKYSLPSKEIPFSKSEYRDRLIKIRKVMARGKIDLMFLSAPESLFYISDIRRNGIRHKVPKYGCPQVELPFMLIMTSSYTSTQRRSRFFADTEQSPPTPEYSDPQRILVECPHELFRS